MLAILYAGMIQAEIFWRHCKKGEAWQNKIRKSYKAVSTDFLEFA
jgi:hypothetical protein